MSRVSGANWPWLHGVQLNCKVIMSHPVGFQARCTTSGRAARPSRGVLLPFLSPFQVNGILVDLPFNHGTQLRAYISGVHGFIKTDFDVIVTFDWHSYARVILPSTYSRSVCGLCGNADGNPEDDFALPNGTSATDEVQFADAWKVADVPGCSAGCTKDCQVCTEAEKRAYRGDKHCGVLVKKQGPFAACHGAIDPAPYFDDCLFDTCLYKGHQETVCRAVSAYVTACQSQGIRIEPWRTAAFCSAWGSVRGDPLGMRWGGCKGAFGCACMEGVGFAWRN